MKALSRLHACCIDWYHMLFALYLSHRTRCLYLLHLLKFDLASIWGRHLPSGLRGLKFSLRFYLHPFCACASSKGSGETARMLKHIRAFTVPKILRIYFPTIVFYLNNMSRLWKDLLLITCGTSKTPHTKTRTDMVWDAGRGLEYILLHRVCI